LEAQDIAARCDDLCRLMEDKLSLRRGPFEARLRRAGRRLPARIRAQGQIVAEAAAMAAHPRLARRIDHAAVHRAYIEIRGYLQRVDRADLRRGALLGILGGLAFNLLLFAVLAIVFLHWRGIV
jgi:hypothetical protein